jgi:4-amino-4-deoxy-L-arabinose transferase-like glycosyltransferase
MAEARGFSWRTMRGIAVVLLLVKLVLLLGAHPFMDETYYFLWGQHPQLSYFDHPALIGWTQGLAGTVLGWNVFGLRAMVLLTLLGDLAFLYLFAQRTQDPQWSFWTTATIFLATPILFGLTSVALPDHLMVFFTLAAVYCVERLRHEPERVRWLYLGGIAAGFAMLSRYNSGVLAGALLAYILIVPDMRRLFLTPHLYLAVLLAVAMQTPVLIWNAQHGLASFGFITGGRAKLPGSGLNLEGLRGYIVGGLSVLSPFIVWPMLRFGFTRRDGHGYARLVFAISTLGFLLASLFTNILIHWNAIAYVAALPFLATHFRSRILLGAQIVYGVLAIGFAAVNYGVLPVMATVNAPDQTSAWAYGWDEVADAVKQVRTDNTIGFVGATDYALASPLAFALHDRDVTSLSMHRDGYDDWFDPEAHRGQDAIIVADYWRQLDPAVAAQFTSVEPVRLFDITRFGKVLDHITIYVAHDFAPAPATD